MILSTLLPATLFPSDLTCTKLEIIAISSDIDVILRMMKIYRLGMRTIIQRTLISNRPAVVNSIGSIVKVDLPKESVFGSWNNRSKQQDKG